MTMDDGMEALFWLSVGFIGYAYAGYPLCLFPSVCSAADQ